MPRMNTLIQNWRNECGYGGDRSAVPSADCAVIVQDWGLADLVGLITRILSFTEVLNEHL